MRYHAAQPVGPHSYEAFDLFGFLESLPTSPGHFGASWEFAYPMTAFALTATANPSKLRVIVRSMGGPCISEGPARRLYEAHPSDSRVIRRARTTRAVPVQKRRHRR